MGGGGGVEDGSFVCCVVTDDPTGRNCGLEMAAVRISDNTCR